MNYTFFINYNSVVTQVYPLNWLDCALVDQKEDQVFYRRKFEGSLAFGGKKLCPDFNTLYAIEQANPYARIDLLILLDTDIYWEGFFSTASGEWNLKEKTFTVTPKVTDDYADWDEYGDVDHNILSIAATVTVECNGYSYTRNRWLWDVIEYVAGETFPGCTVVSELFTFASDYVTLKTSKLLYLTIAAKSDIKRPTSSDPATVAYLSFNKLMNILRMFNTYWTYDPDSNIVTIEHISKFNQAAGMDLRTQDIATDMLKYKHNKDKMPKYERFSFMEASSADFLTGVIWYDSPAVDPDTSVEYYNEVTTEIEKIQNDPDSVSDSGFVILCNYLSGGQYYTYQSAGTWDTVVRFNMPLSWSNLLTAYHRHNRVLLTGYVNVTLETFVSAQKNIIHEINAKLCPPNTLDPNKYLTTQLGETYFSGLKGYVDRAVIKPYGEINFTLTYGPEDNDNGGLPSAVKSLVITEEAGSYEIWFDFSEANIYDTYIWLWINPTGEYACQEIIIPAGTLHYYTAIEDPGGPIIEIRYNVSDSSLTGWVIVVNGSTSFTTTTDCGGGGGSPALPAAPTILGHGQYTTCGPIRISWAATGDATYYVLQRKPDVSGNDVWQTLTSQVELFYDDYNAGTQESETFLYRLAAGNISGLSAWSAEYLVDGIMC